MPRKQTLNAHTHTHKERERETRIHEVRQDAYVSGTEEREID